MMTLLTRFKWLVTLLGLGILVGVASAQSTTLTGTIVDPSSQVWSNATISYVFQGNGSFNGVYQWQGANLPSQYLSPQITHADGSGTFSFSVPSSNAITPAGSSWKTTICPRSTASCTTLNISATGTSSNISTIINGNISTPVVDAGILPMAYNSGEVRLVVNAGGLFFNTSPSALVPEYYDGTNWLPFGNNTFACTGQGFGNCIFTNFPGSQTITIASNAGFTIAGTSGGNFFTWDDGAELTVNNDSDIWIVHRSFSISGFQQYTPGDTMDPVPSGLSLFPLTGTSTNSSYLSFISSNSVFYTQAVVSGATSTLTWLAAVPAGSGLSTTFANDMSGLGPTNLGSNSTASSSLICTTANASACIGAGLTLVGDVTGAANANTVVKIHGGTVPASAPCLGTNSSSQPVSVACSTTTGVAGTGQSANLASSRSFGTVFQNTGTTALWVTGSGTVSGGAGDSNGVCLDGPTSPPTNQVYPMTYSFTVAGESAAFVCLIPAGWFYEQQMNVHIANPPTTWYETPMQ